MSTRNPAHRIERRGGGRRQRRQELIGEVASDERFDQQPKILLFRTRRTRLCRCRFPPLATAIGGGGRHRRHGYRRSAPMWRTSRIVSSSTHATKEPPPLAPLP